VLLWNHRWEYDKAPERFAAALDALTARGFDFRLCLLGQRFREASPALATITARHATRLPENAHAPTRAAYLAALDQSHIAVSTARHEFFGLATLEALRRGLAPVLPNDLGYPELLPRALRHAPHLFDAASSPEAIADAVETTTRALWAAELPSEAFLAATDRFQWSRVAPELDAHLSAAAN